MRNIVNRIKFFTYYELKILNIGSVMVLNIEKLFIQNKIK
jgi:hypothetical protein